MHITWSRTLCVALVLWLGAGLHQVVHGSPDQRDATLGVRCRFRALLVSMEFSDPVFSGNGVLSRLQAAALLQKDVCLVVLTAVPEDTGTEQGDPTGDDRPGVRLSIQGDASLVPLRLRDSAAQPVLGPAVPGWERQLQVVALTVPLSKWHRLDRLSAWREFGGTPSAKVALRQVFRALVDASAFQAVLGVDWSSMESLQALWPAMFDRAMAPRGAPETQPPLVYLNLRVYSASPELLTTGSGTFYAGREAACVEAAAITVALQDRDARLLRRLGAASDTAPPPDVRVLLPSLRPEMVALSTATPDQCLGLDGAGRKHEQSSATAVPVSPPAGLGDAVARRRWDEAVRSGRRFLTCCVRLAPEKNAALFAELVEELAASGALERARVAPFLCGAAGDPSTARQIRRRVLTASRHSVVVSDFMGPPDLRRVLSNTALNVHPPLHDAFGMTVAEAAAFGAASLVHHPDGAMAGSVGSAGTMAKQRTSVGVLQLLRPEVGQVVTMDLTRPVSETAAGVEALLLENTNARNTSAPAEALVDSGTGATQSRERHLGALAKVGCAAREAARAWTSEAAGEALLAMMLEVAAAR